MALQYVAPLDGQEGMALWEAALLRSGQGLYLPVTPDRFVSAPYPPVHPLLLAIFGFFEGPHVFWAGRLISLVAAFGVVVCGAGIVRRVTGSWAGAVAAAVLLLAFTPLQIWALRIKPDTVGLLLTAGGLWLTAIGGTERAHRDQFWWPALSMAAVVFVLAHFAKQTMLAGPLAAGTYLLLCDWRTALRWGALYLGLLLIVWIALDVVTHGQYTYHVWTLHRLPWSAPRMWKLASQLRDAWPLLLLSIIAAAVGWRRPTVIDAYLVWAPFSLIGAGVLGSHHNHLLETGTALALVGGQAAGLGITRGGLLRGLAPVLLAIQLWVWREPLPWFAGDYMPDPNYGRYIDFIRNTPGEIMADDVGLVYAAGLPLRYDDPAAMGPAATLGLWDERAFVAHIRAGGFSALLLPIQVFESRWVDVTGRWTPAMLDAIREAYTVKFSDTLYIYVPRDQ